MQLFIRAETPLLLVETVVACDLVALGGLAVLDDLWSNVEVAEDVVTW